MLDAKLRYALLLAVGFLVISAPVHAQWVNRTITLEPGWNAVYLDVQPENPEPSAVFAGIPLDRVFVWYKRTTTVKFITDPAELRPEQPDWLMYIPPGKTGSQLSSLVSVIAGYCYLIKIEGDSSVPWTVRGQPIISAPKWVRDSYNLAGFHIDPNAPPTFESFFAYSTQHAGQAVYRLTAAGHWEVVANPSVDALKPNEAYWVYTNGASEYVGPITVSLQYGSSLDFGSSVDEALFSVTNNTNDARNIFVSQMGSESPTFTTQAANLGSVPLSYLDTTAPLGERSWLPMTGPLAFTLEAGATVAVRLEVRRRDMAAASLPSGFSTGLYQDVLEIRDTQGSLFSLGVVSDGLQSQENIAKALKSGKSAPHPRAGLWVGAVEVNAVAYVAKPFARDALVVMANDLLEQFDVLDLDADGQLTFAEALPGSENITRYELEQMDLDGDEYLRSTELNSIASSQQGIGVTQDTSAQNYPPLPVADASEFQFRVILHVDENGVARLLRHVTKMWRTPDYDVAGDEGEYVLITNDDLLQNIPKRDDGRYYFLGTNPRDGESVGGRISTNAFAFNDPIVLTGSFPWEGETGSGGLEGVVTLPYDDSLNPFMHKYHPDHDNLGSDGKPYGWQAAVAKYLYDNFDSLPHANTSGFTFTEAENATSSLDYEMTQGVYGYLDADTNGLLTQSELAVLALGEQGGDGIESYTVTRTLQFDFQNAEDCPECGASTSSPGWGDVLLAGTYAEVIGGLHKTLGPVTQPENQTDLKVSGTFVLRRVSTIGVLTDAV